VTSVECERSFSTQNRLKNKYRSSLKSENLDILISVTMSGVSVATFDPRIAIKLWLSKKRGGRVSCIRVTHLERRSTVLKSRRECKVKTKSTRQHVYKLFKKLLLPS